MLSPAMPLQARIDVGGGKLHVAADVEPVHAAARRHRSSALPTHAARSRASQRAAANHTARRPQPAPGLAACPGRTSDRRNRLSAGAGIPAAAGGSHAAIAAAHDATSREGREDPVARRRRSIRRPASAPDRRPVPWPAMCAGRSAIAGHDLQVRHMRPDRGRERVERGAWNRRLAGRIDVRQHHHVRQRQRRPELRQQVARARVAMRLEHRDQARRAIPVRAARRTAAISVG